jgi:dodecin
VLILTGGPGFPDWNKKEAQKMAVVEVIEILAESTKSWEDATKAAVAEAAKTVREIQNVYIESLKALLKTTKLSGIALMSRSPSSWNIRNKGVIQAGDLLSNTLTKNVSGSTIKLFKRNKKEVIPMVKQ